MTVFSLCQGLLKGQHIKVSKEDRKMAGILTRHGGSAIGKQLCARARTANGDCVGDIRRNRKRT